MVKNNMINWLILFILSIIWGSSFILMKKSLIIFSYLEVGFIRMIIAFLSLSPFLYYSFSNFRKTHIIPLGIVSIIGTLLPAILFAKAQTNLNSSIVGMLNALTPIFTLIIGISCFSKKKYTPNNIIGIIIGIIGSYVLLFSNNQSHIGTKYVLMVISATILYAISINTIKEKLTDLKSIDIAVLSSFFSAIIPIVFILNGNFYSIIEKTSANFSVFIHLIILGSICTSLAIIIFNYLIKRSNALFASSTTYLIPIFAIIWGFIDHELIMAREIIGMLIILVGVFIMNVQR